MRAMAFMERSEAGAWLVNSPIRTEVSARRLEEVLGL
jgi:hypothetical protein